MCPPLKTVGSLAPPYTNSPGGFHKNSPAEPLLRRLSERRNTDQPLPTCVRWSGLAILLLVLVATPVEAAQSKGTFLADGHMSVPFASTGEFGNGAAFWPAFGRSSTATITAETVLIERFEYVVQGADSLRLRTENRSATYTLTDVRIEVAGMPDGWVGLVSGDGFEARAGLPSDGKIKSTGNARLGNVGAASDAANSPGFHHADTKSSLRFAIESPTVVKGAWTLKISGPEVLLAARENTTLIQTGNRAPSDALVTERVESWLVLHIEGATGVISTASQAESAAEQLSVSFDGNLVFRAVSGEFRTATHRYETTNMLTVLEGELHMDVVPRQFERRMMLDVFVAGDLVSTNIDGQPIFFPLEEGAGRWQFATLLLLVAAVASGGVFVTRQARRVSSDPVLNVEQCVDLSNAAAQERRFALALDWNRQAQRLCGPSARLKADEAWFQSRLGDVEGALTSLADSARLSTDGEADYLAARILIEAGGEMHEIETFCLRALERSPSIALEIEDDPVFQAMRTTPRIALALRRAFRQIE